MRNQLLLFCIILSLYRIGQCNNSVEATTVPSFIRIRRSQHKSFNTVSRTAQRSEAPSGDHKLNLSVWNINGVKAIAA